MNHYLVRLGAYSQAHVACEQECEPGDKLVTMTRDAFGFTMVYRKAVPGEDVTDAVEVIRKSAVS